MKANLMVSYYTRPVRSYASLLQSCPGWPGGPEKFTGCSSVWGLCMGSQVEFQVPRVSQWSPPLGKGGKVQPLPTWRKQNHVLKRLGLWKYNPGNAEGILCQVEIRFFSLIIILDLRCILTRGALSFLLAQERTCPSCSFLMSLQAVVQGISVLRQQVPSNDKRKRWEVKAKRGADARTWLEQREEFPNKKYQEINNSTHKR